jgi:hypothetical protein
MLTIAEIRFGHGFYTSRRRLLDDLTFQGQRER